MKTRNNSYGYSRGAVNGNLVVIILLSIGLIALGGLSVWSLLQYQEAKTDIDGKIAVAEAEAKKEQAEIEQTKFLEEEKNPNRQFVGPADYGRPTFNYPKTWSLYVANDASSGGTYEAYLNPIFVPQVRQNERFALRVTIEDRPFDAVINTYTGRINNGDLRTSSTSVNGATGQRLDGSFTKDIRGSAVVYKIRDKTLTIRTDADTFKSDFDKLIQTIEFNE